MSAVLHVETVGAGPPLVLLHGWGMHSGLWGPVLPRLAARFRVHAVDLPGHGHNASKALNASKAHNASTAISTLPAMVAAVAATMAERRDDQEAPLTVLGWSLGALVALQWALASGGEVSRLILVGATPRFVAGPDWPHGMDHATLRRFGDEMRVAHKLTLQRFLTLQLQGSDDGGATLSMMRRALFVRGEPDASALAQGLDLLAGTDLRDVVTRLRQPALVIAGDRDTMTPLAASRWLAEALPAGNLAVIPGAGHVPFWSHPDAFMSAVSTLPDEP